MWLGLAHLFLILSSLLISVQSQNWTHHTVLDDKGKVNLYWKPPEDTRGDSIITFKLEMLGKGSICLAFSPNGEIPGSDIVAGCVKEGEAYIQDLHADENGIPLRDDQQDYELIDGYENDNVTVLIFRRKLDTCDNYDWKIDKGTVRLIYAFPAEDPASDEPFYLGENRGSKSIILLQKAIGQNMDLDLTSMLQWNVRNSNVSIPPVLTMYWCKIVKSPELSKKHQIVYIKPVIQEGHEQNVHHMTIFECDGETPAEYESLLDDNGHECYKPGMPDAMFRCNALYINWAIGGYDIPMPENVGLPLYPGSGDYYMLQVHYDNPELKDGMIDESGYTFYYTPDLRQHDAGTLLLLGSVSPRVFIPPKEDKFGVAAHANPECFTSMLPDSGVKVFSAFFHAHSLIKEMNIRHFRGNEELAPLYEDKHYDHNFQTYRYFPQEVPIFPNDSITLHCTYNSTKRNSTTFSGMSSKEEMCGTIIVYYPRSNGTIAISGPSFATINTLFNTSVTSEADVFTVFENYDFDHVNMSEVQKGLEYSEHETLCSFAPLPDVPIMSLASYPKDFIPYEPPSTCKGTIKD